MPNKCKAILVNQFCRDWQPSSAVTRGSTSRSELLWHSTWFRSFRSHHTIVAEHNSEYPCATFCRFAALLPNPETAARSKSTGNEALMTLRHFLNRSKGFGDRPLTTHQDQCQFKYGTLKLINAQNSPEHLQSQFWLVISWHKTATNVSERRSPLSTQPRPSRWRHSPASGRSVQGQGDSTLDDHAHDPATKLDVCRDAEGQTSELFYLCCCSQSAEW
jgi:hypothetical protein